LSHIHVPDGVLPLWIVLVGWGLAAVLVGLAVRSLQGDSSRRVPLLGVMAAVMLVGMSTEIVPIAYHINLSVLAGIVLGPAYGILAALIVNVFLALFGHGGITVVGLNTVVVGAETALGYLLFRLLGRAIRSPGLRAGIVTGVTLFMSTWILVAVVWLSGLDAASAREVGAVDPATLAFGDPFGGGLVTNRIVAPEPTEGGVGSVGIGLGRMLIVWFGLGFVGWVLEGLVTGAVVGFVARVRPDLVLGRRQLARSQARQE
jgi:cobalt/nickel transport system permease protein